MPREERRIFFDYEEAYKAVQLLSLEKGLAKQPAGSVSVVEISPNDPQQINFVILKEKSGLEAVVPFSRDFLLAALMTMCHGIGIPLPKGANKSLEIMPEKIIIRVQMVRKQS